MDKREDGVIAREQERELALDADEAQSEESAPEEIEEEIVAIRNEVGTLIEELDRRRHDATNLPLQLRRHPLVIVAVTGACIVALRAVWKMVADSSRPLSPRERASKIAEVLEVLRRDPERVLNAIEERPDPRLSVLSALTRIAGVAGQQMVKRAV